MSLANAAAKLRVGYEQPKGRWWSPFAWLIAGVSGLLFQASWERGKSVVVRDRETGYEVRRWDFRWDAAGSARMFEAIDADLERLSYETFLDEYGIVRS